MKCIWCGHESFIVKRSTYIKGEENEMQRGVLDCYRVMDVQNEKINCERCGGRNPMARVKKINLNFN
jgi:ribosomal protein L37E